MGEYEDFGASFGEQGKFSVGAILRIFLPLRCLRTLFFSSSMDFLILGFCLCLCWVFVLRGVVDLNQGFLPVFMPI